MPLASAERGPSSSSPTETENGPLLNLSEDYPDICEGSRDHTAKPRLNPQPYCSEGLPLDYQAEAEAAMAPLSHGGSFGATRPSFWPAGARVGEPGAFSLPTRKCFLFKSSASSTGNCRLSSPRQPPNWRAHMISQQLRAGATPSGPDTVAPSNSSGPIVRVNPWSRGREGEMGAGRDFP